ncbi:MAG: ankyrin repeat domain-containing protein [Elusimicrobiota bacterium]
MNPRTLFALAAALSAAGCSTPMHAAIRNRDNGRVRALLSSGTNVELREAASGKSTPLITAAETGNIEAAKALLDAGADVNALTKPSKGNPLDVVKALVENRDVSKSLGGNRGPGVSALTRAVQQGHIEMVELLLERGSSPQARSVDPESGREHTPITWAIENGRSDIVQVLLKHGAPVDELALKRADAKGNPVILAMLTPKASAPTREAAGPAESSAPAAPTFADSGVDRPAYHAPPREQDFALVVGVEKYSDLTSASYAERDAATVERHLLAMGVPRRNLVTLTGTRATRTGLQKYLETWLPKNVTPESRVYFFYSGHGAPNPTTGDAYLVPFDGDPNFLQDTAYPLERLYKKMGELKAKDVVMVVDACFSGSGGRSVLAKGARPLVLSKAEPAQALASNITVFSAASNDQITGTLDEYGHGIMTYFFLKGLNGDAKDKDGRVSAESLYKYLLPKVQDEARRQNREQTPVLQGKSEGGLILR